MVVCSHTAYHGNMVASFGHCRMNNFIRQNIHHCLLKSSHNIGDPVQVVITINLDISLYSGFKPAETKKDGSQYFREASWEEALDLVAGKMLLTAQYGGGSVASFSLKKDA